MFLAQTPRHVIPITMPVSAHTDTSIDYTGRRGSAAGQHDLVIQAQKGLGPTVSQGQKYPSRKSLDQYDLQTQSRYGHGPTVSYNEPPSERHKSAVQHDLLTQAVYDHGMTVPVSQEVVEAPKATKDYNLSTQAHLTHDNVKDVRNPWGNKRDFTGQSYDLSSQYRNLH